MTEDVEFQAYRGSDSVLLAWWHSERVPGCLGYAIQRRADGADAAPLPAYVGFPVPGQLVQLNAQGQPSTLWPFQRFTWTDFDPPRQGKIEYQVTAIGGTPQSPKPMGMTSAWIQPTTPRFGIRKPFFNFGIVGSRWFAEKAADYPKEFGDLRAALAPRHGQDGPAPGAADKALQDVLALHVTKGDAASPTIGEALGGPLARQVKSMLDAAEHAADTELYLTLFELSDPDLIRRLGAIGSRCHLILANGTHEHGAGENAGAAATLQLTQVKLSRRILTGNGVYAHNKFMVVVRGGKPEAAWTGSTNWSSHGLYTQVNNGLLVEDPDVAEAYLDEWKRLEAAGSVTPPPPLQGAKDQYHFDRNGVTTSVFISPHRMPKASGANSPDLKYAASLIRNARQGILTLMLDPGWAGSLLQNIRQQAENDATLYIRGVVNTDPTIHAHGGDPTAIGFLHGPEAIPSNYDIVLPGEQRQDGKPILDYLGRVGIVVVHSKVVVIDPLGDHPVVMTGSHNAGVKAATINDDNLIVVEGDRDLALAYAINAISVFNHFWWRHNMAPPHSRKAAKGDGAPIGGPARLTSSHEWAGLRPNDGWQDKFYAGDGEAAEARFWGLHR